MAPRNNRSSLNLATITLELKGQIKQAALQYMDRLNVHVHEHGEGYWASPKRNRHAMRRAIFVEELAAMFQSDFPGAIIRTDNGGFYVIIDGIIVLHVKKVHRVTHEAWIPKALIDHSTQLPLSDDFVTDENRKLSDYHGVVIGYVENPVGELVSLFLIDQDENGIYDEVAIELFGTTPFAQPTPQISAVPKTQFTAKRSDRSKGENEH